MFISLNKENTDLDTTSNIIKFQLKEDILAKKISLCSTSIPLSYYLINSSNKYIKVYESETPYGAGDTVKTNLTLTEGNYSATALASHIETVMNATTAKTITYSVAYNSVNGKFTISTATADRKFYMAGSSGGTAFFPILGFVYETDYFPITVDVSKLNTTFTGTYKGDLSGIRQMYILTDMPLKSSYILRNNNLTHFNVIAIVNVIYNSDNIIYSLEQQNLPVRIPSEKINASIYQIRIIDDKFNNIDFEGVNYLINFHIE